MKLRLLKVEFVFGALSRDNVLKMRANEVCDIQSVIYENFFDLNCLYFSANLHNNEIFAIIFIYSPDKE